MNRAERRKFSKDKKKLAARVQEKNGLPKEKAEELIETIEKIARLDVKMAELLPILEAQEKAHKERKENENV